MKKAIIGIIIIFIIIISIIGTKYYSYKAKINAAKSLNAQYEEY